MRSSKEIRGIFEGRGLEVQVLQYGTSYRAGGSILIGEKKYLSDHLPAVITLSGEKSFDGTGYDGRGRQYDIYIFRAPGPGETGFVPISEGQFYALPENQRLQLGANTRSGTAHYYGNPEADDLGDLGDIFAKLGL